MRRAVSTISSVDASIRRWSKAFSRIRIRWFCTVHLLKTAGARGGPRKKRAKSTDVVGGCQQLKPRKSGVSEGYGISHTCGAPSSSRIQETPVPWQRILTCSCDRDEGRLTQSAGKRVTVDENNVQFRHIGHSQRRVSKLRCLTCPDSNLAPSTEHHKHRAQKSPLKAGFLGGVSLL